MKCARTIIAVLLSCISVFAATATASDFPTVPTTRNGQPWRIAYYEGGPHNNYYYYLTATVRGLMSLGWIDDMDLPDYRNKDARQMWNWLVAHASNRNLRFLADGYYSANWDNDVRSRLRKRVTERLAHRQDIDLVFAMGTWAGKDLATDQHHVPTLVMSSSDPVGAGIVKSIEDSGLDHVFARLDPTRYERQVRVFHDIIGFRKLGVAYENTVYGRSYAAIDMIEKVARERGFEVVRCFTKSDIADMELAGRSVLDCYRELARNVDAIYVTVQGGVNAHTIPEIVRIANSHRIPTFSQLGSAEVKSGFLLSISRAGGFKPVGRFLAATTAQIFNGAKPRQLDQVFEEAPNIAINLKTAEMVGLYLYADVLAAADEIYRDISAPD